MMIHQHTSHRLHPTIYLRTAYLHYRIELPTLKLPHLPDARIEQTWLPGSQDFDLEGISEKT